MIKDITFPFNNISSEPSSKNKLKIWTYSLKRNSLAIIFCTFTILLIIFSKTNLIAAKNGLVLWATAVVPSLFPFFVANELLSNTNVISFLGKLLNPIMRPLFNVPGEASFALLMGLISGYPVGAKIVSNFVEQGICTKEEAERMLSFTNNSGPLFIIGTVGITLFGNKNIGILLLITHILACISVGIILKFTSKFHPKTHNKYSSNWNRISNFGVKANTSSSFSSLGEILGKSISNSISTILMIGGFVVLFSVIISILNETNILNYLSIILSPILYAVHISPEFAKGILSGIVELTNGVNIVANLSIVNLNISIILTSFLLGFGGISVMLQVFSIISKSGLSIKTYIFGKFLQGIIASIYTFIALQFISF